MNANQASAIARVLQEATYPSTCPINGQRYTAEELAEMQPYGEPAASIGVYLDDHEGLAGGVELLEVRVRVAMQNAVELAVHPDGRLLVWSTVRIPPEMLDCECDDPSFPHSTPPGSDQARESCPVHGSGVRELDCWRLARVGWEIGHHPRHHPARRQWLGGSAVAELPAREELGPPYWKYTVAEGDPLVDPIPAYRAQREASKAAPTVGE